MSSFQQKSRDTQRNMKVRPIHGVAGGKESTETFPEKTQTLDLLDKDFIYLFIYLFWPHYTAHGILVRQPGTEPATPALEAQSLNHWTTREVP